MFCCVGLSVVGIVVLLKVYTRVTMGIYKGKERLDGKTVIVTGASAGIGLESSKDFAKRGARVVMLCRDMAKGEKVRSDIIQETSNSNLTLKRVDFTDLASVRQCANEILKEETRIDVLLNNAGAASMDHEITKDGMQILMQSNHFGPFLFTNILLGMIKQSAPSRIVNVSSIAHKRAKLDLNNLNAKLREGFPSMVYSNSKLANVYFTIDLANKLKGTGVTVNSLHPGLVLTEIFRNSPSLGQIVLNMLCWIVGKNCWEGAQTQIMLCVSKSVEKVTGEYFSDCKAVSTSSAGKDKNRAALLWTLSEKAVGLRDSEKHYE